MDLDSLVTISNNGTIADIIASLEDRYKSFLTMSQAHTRQRGDNYAARSSNNDEDEVDHPTTPTNERASWGVGKFEVPDASGCVDHCSRPGREMDGPSIGGADALQLGHGQPFSPEPDRMRVKAARFHTGRTLTDVSKINDNVRVRGNKKGHDDYAIK